MGALLLVAIALIVLGGGDGSDRDDAFAEEIEAVCRDANEDVLASQAVLPAGATDEQAVSWLREVYIDLQRERVAALRALDTAGDEEFTALVDAHEAVVDRVADDPAQFLRADPFAGLAPRWDDLGAPSCGRIVPDA